MTRTVRVLGAIDIVSGAVALVDASWLADQLGVAASTVRIAAVALLLLGIDNVLFAAKPLMARVNTIVEALVALAAVDLAILGDANGTGTALLVVTAVYCAAVAVRLVTIQRTPSLVAA